MRMAAAARLVEAAEQVDDRGLAAAGRADQGDHLPGLDPQREVRQDRLAVLVVEVDVLELDLLQQAGDRLRIRAVAAPQPACRSA